MDLELLLANRLANAAKKILTISALHYSKAPL